MPPRATASSATTPRTGRTCPPQDIAVAAETITRLTISYLMLPGDAPAEILATRLADLATKLLRKDRS